MVKQTLSLLPPNALVGLITFGQHVYVHELGHEAMPKAVMLRGTAEVDGAKVTALQANDIELSSLRLLLSELAHTMQVQAGHAFRCWGSHRSRPPACGVRKASSSSAGSCLHVTPKDQHRPAMPPSHLCTRTAELFPACCHSDLIKCL